MKTVTIPFQEFIAGSAPSYSVGSIAPFSGFETLLDSGLLFFGGLGVALIGLAALEKLGVSVNPAAVTWSLTILFWVGMLVLLVLRNPIWGWI